MPLLRRMSPTRSVHCSLWKSIFVSRLARYHHLGPQQQTGVVKAREAEEDEDVKMSVADEESKIMAERG